MARYIVGIDLGTTNSAVAYVDTTATGHRITSFPVPQLVAEATVAERPTLPSFLYVGGEHDVAPGALALPWDADRRFAVGEFARAQGARVPGRLVTSAKSWLCHGGVDREAAILPWGRARRRGKALADRRLGAAICSTSARRGTARLPDAPLEAQDVILTVPASFDEVARELTVAAAERRRAAARRAARGAAGRVLRLDRRACAAAGSSSSPALRLVLVIDVGGGTTDFSLIRIDREGPHVGLERLAVGDHILLGGDNIDLALARLLEPRLGEKLDSQRWHALTNLCRAAKETLLGADAPAEIPIRLAGRGRTVVGGTLSATLTRTEVEALVLEGFFPLTAADALPRKTPRAGVQEWGLPFAVEAEVSRHLAAFLKQHATAFPDVVLFNGGALTPPVIRERLCGLMAHWHAGRRPMVLETSSLDLAVSRGAAYYGLVRRGLGVRIGGGSARAYFLGLAPAPGGVADVVEALCLVQRGMHEGTEIEITTPEFTVLANQPVSFPLFTSNTRLGDRAGTVVRAARDSLSELPAIRTVLRFGKKLAATALPAHIVSKLTEIGTLEVWCRSLTTDHRWRLQFNLRERTAVEDDATAPESSVELAVSPDRLAAATAALTTVFSADGGAAGDPVTLTRGLETALDAGKDAWPLTAIRALWETLFAAQAARAASPAHEARWLNLCGFLLRPGFGHQLDDWRIQQLWKLYSQGLRFPRATQCRVEWWGLWKRIAAGLNRAQQTELYNQTAPYLLPRLRSRRDKRSAVGPQEVREYWQLLASCERLASPIKVELGAAVLPAVVKGKATDAEIWALGRLGARAPFAGPLNCVVPRESAEEWVAALLDQPDWPRPVLTIFALVQLARCVGDRERDLDEDLRRRLAARLRAAPQGERSARLVSEPIPLEGQERARIFDESLPVGLQLRS